MHVQGVQNCFLLLNMQIRDLLVDTEEQKNFNQSNVTSKMA